MGPTPEIASKLEIAAALMIAALTLSSCQSDSAIDESGQVFDDIAADSTITLIGTEPFWTFELAKAADGSHRATYSTPDNPQGSTFAVTRFAGNNGLGFSGEFAGSAVQIAVTPGDCSDGMSDRSYPYTATITLGDTMLSGCGFTDQQSYLEEETP